MMDNLLQTSAATVDNMPLGPIRELRSKRLLVADDARVIREIIKSVAVRGGWEIVSRTTT